MIHFHAIFWPRTSTIFPRRGGISYLIDGFGWLPLGEGGIQYHHAWVSYCTCTYICVQYDTHTWLHWSPPSSVEAPQIHNSENWLLSFWETNEYTNVKIVGNVTLCMLQNGHVHRPQVLATWPHVWKLIVLARDQVARTWALCMLQNGHVHRAWVLATWPHV